MEPQAAADHLQVIRTLMERSALYRRALAPVMLAIGTLGVAAGIAGRFLDIRSSKTFCILWVATAAVSLGVALLLMRRQALRDKEPFWSPPTRRIAQAVAPLFAAGAGLGLLAMLKIVPDPMLWTLAASWMVLYGCALNSAGFFMVRGIRWLGWIFVAAGCLFGSVGWLCDRTFVDANTAMAAGFGGLHLVYGFYLQFTEKRKNAL